MEKSFYLPISMLLIFSQYTFGAQSSNWTIDSRVYFSEETSAGIYTSVQRYGLDFHLGGYFPFYNDLNNKIDYGVAKPFYINDDLRFSLGFGALNSDLYTEQKIFFNLNKESSMYLGYRFHFDNEFLNRNEIYLGFSYFLNNYEQDKLDEKITINNEEVVARPQEKIEESYPILASSYFEINEVVRFNSNSSEIINTKPLDLLLKKLSDKKSENVSVVITGHADSTGPKSLNQNLSKSRAKEVSKYFDSFKDVKVSGAGASQPIAPNDTVEGRALNRRVNVEVEINK